MFDGLTRLVRATPISLFCRFSQQQHVLHGMEIAVLVLHGHRAVAPSLDVRFCKAHVSWKHIGERNI